MFFAAMIPVLLLSGYMIALLRRLEKHDRVLYRFCEVRRKLMRLLRQSGTELSPEDYRVARALLDMLETNIHNYQETKKFLLNGRRFLKSLRTYSKSAVEVANLAMIRDPRVAEVRNELGRAVLLGILDYTPLLRSELLVRFIAGSASFFARLGWRRMKTVASTLLLAKDTANRQGQEFGYAH